MYICYVCICVSAILGMHVYTCIYFYICVYMSFGKREDNFSKKFEVSRKITLPAGQKQLL